MCAKVKLSTRPGSISLPNDLKGQLDTSALPAGKLSTESHSDTKKISSSKQTCILSIDSVCVWPADHENNRAAFEHAAESILVSQNKDLPHDDRSDDTDHAFYM